MKKQLLLLATIIIGFSSANAQCTPTSSCIPDPATTGYCTTPAEGANLPNATANTPYTTVIQVSVGTSAGGGFATITDVTIGSVTLPNGLSYTTNPSNGVIPGGTNACIEITGTPTAIASKAASPKLSVSDGSKKTSAISKTWDVSRTFPRKMT